MLRTTIAYFFMGIYILALAPVGIAWNLISGSSLLLYRLGHFCLRATGWLAGIRVKVRGRERVAAGCTYLFLSNHQGNLDGPALYYATGRNLRAVIKQEIMRVPVLSRIFKILDFVPVNRKDPIQAHAGIDRAAELLRSGHSFFAFPEGTRSRNGDLGEFKKGVFVLGIKAGVPVVPVTIANSRSLQPPGAYRIRPGVIDVTFHDPIATAGLEMNHRNELLQNTRAAIASAMKPSGEV
jgi:1-acyl-sn-glycerol-3-phosphate acyltransferase